MFCWDVRGQGIGGGNYISTYRGGNGTLKHLHILGELYQSLAGLSIVKSWVLNMTVRGMFVRSYSCSFKTSLIYKQTRLLCQIDKSAIRNASICPHCLKSDEYKFPNQYRRWASSAPHGPCVAQIQSKFIWQ